MAGPFAVTVTTTATEILPDRAERTSVYIENNAGGGKILFLGQDSNLTIANGIAIADGGLVVEDMGHRLHKGPWFGIVDSGTADVRVWERTHRG